MPAKSLQILSTLALCLLTACGGGSDSSEPLSNNACASLGLNTRIINGTTCATDGSPVLSLTLVSRNGNASLCSGTLITSSQILTAAHCFVTEDVLSVYTEVDGERVFGSRVRVHPNAVVNAAAGKAENDVAVLTLEKSVNRPTVPLITSEAPEKGDRFAIFGYGKDSSGNVGTLESGEMRITEVTRTSIVANYDGEGSNTCNGDSGGPALTTIPDSAHIGLIGITSSGTSRNCQKGDRSFFVNLQASEILNFIRSAAPGVQTR